MISNDLRSPLNTPNFRHGLCNTREYVAWRGMQRRCANPKNPDFKYYGGRGISICERWKSFIAFYTDMGNCPPGHSIDRINNDLGYSPENCRWANAQTQSRNRRISHAPMNIGSAHGMAKINEDIARSICQAHEATNQIAARYGVSDTLVRMIKKRKLWAHATGEITHGN